MSTGSALPSPDSTTFAEEMRTFESSLVDPMDTFTSILHDVERPQSDRFAALYGALQYLNRNYQFDEYARLCFQYEQEFGGEPYFETFRVLLARGDAHNLRGIKKAVRHAEEAVDRLPDRPGVLHQFASVVADLLEKDANQKALGSTALEKVRLAIKLTPVQNPNFHYTFARLHYSLGDEDEALEEVGIAIALQETATESGVRRLARFETLRALIIMSSKQTEILKQIAQANTELAKTRGEQVQVLGVLAAVLALLTSSVTLTGYIGGDDGIRVVLASTGAIVFAFSGLLLSFAHLKVWRLVVAIALGLSLIALSIYLGKA